MNDDQKSGPPIVLIGATIGAVAGFLLQAATTVWVVTNHGMPGLFEVAAMFVIASAVAVAGAIVGAALGLLVKTLVAIVRRD